MDHDVFAPMTEWPIAHGAAAVFTPTSVLATTGDTGASFELASVTKLFTAAGCLLAAEELALDIDAPIDHELTLADLLAHSSGMHPADSAARLAEPATRRIYSNAGYERAAAHIEALTDFGFAEYLSEGVFQMAGMTTARLVGSPAHGGFASVDDLVAFVQTLTRGELLAPRTVERMTTPHRSELIGVLPGYGRQEPNPWGVGPEIRGTKSPHWTAATNSEATWGHFGQAGTFVWFDPALGLGCVVLTDEAFGPWALHRWPALSARVVAEFGEIL